MIAVRIPKDIRSYKEKLLLGLTLRQLIFTTLALGISIPLYIFGRNFLHEEVLSWLVMLVALPCAAFGFVKYNGMVFEQFLMAILRQFFLYPAKRKLRYENRWRNWQSLADEEESVQADKNGKKSKKETINNSFITAHALLIEAEKALENQEKERKAK